MAYFRSENNIFCDSVTASAASGESASGIAPSSNLRTPVGPRKLEGVSASFKSAATGKVEIRVEKSGLDILVRSIDLTSAESLVVTGIGLWLTGSDTVEVKNLTGADADIVVDFAY